MDDRGAAMVEGRQRLPEFTAGWNPASRSGAKPIEASGGSFEQARRVEAEVGANARSGNGTKVLLHGLLDQAGRSSVGIGA